MPGYSDLNDIDIVVLLSDRSVQQLLDVVDKYPDWTAQQYAGYLAKKSGQAQSFDPEQIRIILKRFKLNTPQQRVIRRFITGEWADDQEKQEKISGLGPLFLSYLKYRRRYLKGIPFQKLSIPGQEPVEPPAPITRPGPAPQIPSKQPVLAPEPRIIPETKPQPVVVQFTPAQMSIFKSLDKFFSLLKPFSLTFLASFLFFFLGSLFFDSVFSAGSIISKIGMFFAFIALSCGTFFFIYSLKYYITVGVVLSWSRTGRIERKRKGGILGLLALIFGLEIEVTEEGSNPAQESKNNIGLNIDLEKVTLERTPFVSIQVAAYNEKRVIDRFLLAATSMDYPEYEIIVADDSTDETVSLLGEWRKNPRVKISHRNTREGFKGGALKKALEVTDQRAEFILIFDADFIPYPDTIVQFLKYFQASAGSLSLRGEHDSARRSNPLNNGASEGIAALPPVARNDVSNIAAVQGYQWHVLNKSENWITRGVRSEYSGSYVIERSGEEIYKGLKQISGSVYMIRKDVLESIGWGTSITEDFELTLRLYEQGYKVVYTPYIQAPAEAVSTIKRLIRQRMRWAEGHSYNVKRMFMRLMWGKYETNVIARRSPQATDEAISSAQAASDASITGLPRRSFLAPRNDVFTPSPLTFSEKLEFLYLSPYYLQAFFFILGSFCWFVSEIVFRVRLPFWTETFGWSLVLTNLFALPLMNMIGMFMEESDEKDYLGILSFVLLSYVVAPFQAFASVKGFLEKEEGPWFRTPKTGRITDSFVTGRISKFVKSLFGKGAPIVAESKLTSLPIFNRNPYLALTKVNNESVTYRKGKKWTGKGVLVSLMLTIMLANYLTFFPMNHPAQATWYPSQNWYNNNYLFKKQITINHTLVNTTGESTTNLTNFPVLISNTDAALCDKNHSGYVQSTSGYDIIFTDSTETTQLDHEIELYDGTEATAANCKIVMWVRIPALSSSSDTVIYIYYDNSSVTTSQENISGAGKTWDSNYKAVWHMKESGNGTAGEYKDSTNNSNNGQGGAGNASYVPAQATGMIGYGEQFDGTNDLIDVGTSSTIDLHTGGTFEAWINRTSCGGGSGYGRILDRSTGVDGDGGYSFQECGGNGYPHMYVEVNNTDLIDSDNFTNNTWTHVAMSFNGVIWRTYVNGTAGPTLSTATLPPTGSIHVYIGNRSGHQDRAFNGTIDEVKLSGSVRSAGWIATEYNNQSSPSTFYSVGSALGQYLYKKKITLNHTLVGMPSVDAVSSTVKTTNVSNFNWTHTTGAQSNRLLMVVVGTYDTATTVTNLTYDGTNLTTLATLNCTVSTDCRNEVWYLLNPASGAKTINVTTNTAHMITADAITFYDVAQTNTFGTNATTAANGTSSTLNVTSVANQLVVDFYVNNAELNCIPTAGAGQTQQVVGGGPCSSSGTADENGISTKPGGASTTTMNWTWAGNNWYADVGVGINPADLTNFPVLITEASDTDLHNYVTNASGYDIIFTDNTEATKLDHEIENFVSSTGEIEAWVRIPTLSASADTIIYMYFGNSSVTSSTANATGVWDSNYKAVWHMKESGNGTAGEYKDSTSYANNGRGGAGTAADVPARATGKIGYAEQFDGTNDLIDVGTNSTIDLHTGGTIEAWGFRTSCGGGNYGRLIDRSTGVDGDGGYSAQSCGDLTANFYAEINGPSNMFNATANSFPVSAWTHLAFSFDGSTWRAYSNGATAGTQTNSTLPGTGSIHVYIGNRSGNTDRAFNGTLDEVRLSNTARSAGWIMTEYNNQSSPNPTFETFGALTQVPENLLLLIPFIFFLPKIIEYIKRRRKLKLSMHYNLIMNNIHMFNAKRQYQNTAKDFFDTL